MKHPNKQLCWVPPDIIWVVEAKGALLMQRGATVSIPGEKASLSAVP